MSAPENPPAFPGQWHSKYDGMHYERGLSLRDWFAGQVLAMSQPDSPERLAQWVYSVADAMLAERDRVAAFERGYHG